MRYKQTLEFANQIESKQTKQLEMEMSRYTFARSVAHTSYRRKYMRIPSNERIQHISRSRSDYFGQREALRELQGIAR